VAVPTGLVAQLTHVHLQRSQRSPLQRQLALSEEPRKRGPAPIEKFSFRLASPASDGIGPGGDSGGLDLEEYFRHVYPLQVDEKSEFDWELYGR
jgi:hypothetical protein